MLRHVPDLNYANVMTCCHVMSSRHVASCHVMSSAFPSYMGGCWVQFSGHIEVILRVSWPSRGLLEGFWRNSWVALAGNGRLVIILGIRFPPEIAIGFKVLPHCIQQDIMLLCYLLHK